MTLQSNDRIKVVYTVIDFLLLDNISVDNSSAIRALDKQRNATEVVCRHGVLLRCPRHTAFTDYIVACNHFLLPGGESRGISLIFESKCRWRSIVLYPPRTDNTFRRRVASREALDSSGGILIPDIESIYILISLYTPAAI